MKKILQAAAAAALSLSLSAAALAATDYYYSGPLDTITGEPVTQAEAEEPERVRLSDTMYYDSIMRDFAYPISDGLSELHSNVADGMIVTTPVRVSTTGSETLTVYRNGETVEQIDLNDISAPGEYTISVKDGDAMQKLLHFVVVGAYANLPGGYTMPEGSYILEATRDGEETYFERSRIGMEDEGAYVIQYVCPYTELTYTLETTIDRTPPQIELEGRRDDRGRFHSAVDVKGLREGETVNMTFNGSSARFPADGHLADSGYYTLELFDSAGNSTTEQFTIMVYFDLNSLIFFSIVCVSIAGILGYVLYKRKKLKIV